MFDFFVYYFYLVSEVKSPINSTTPSSCNSSNTRNESEFLSDKVKDDSSEKKLKDIQQNMTKLGMTAKENCKSDFEKNKKISGGKAVT